MHSLNLNDYLTAFEPPAFEIGDEILTATRDLTLTEVVKYSQQLDTLQASENISSIIELALEVFTLVGLPAQRLVDLPGFAFVQVLTFLFQSPLRVNASNVTASN